VPDVIDPRLSPYAEVQAVISDTILIASTVRKRNDVVKG
jgi:hypothetical protein